MASLKSSRTASPCGHCELKGGAVGHVRLGPQLSTVRIDDRTADRRPQPQTAGLSRVEGVEDALETVRGQPWPRILYRDKHTVRFALTSRDEQLSRSLARSTHRFHRVDDQIEDHLLHFDRIAFNERQALC